MKQATPDSLATDDRFRIEIVEEAERLCDTSGLRHDRHLLVVRGLLALKRRHHDIAIACFTRAATLEATKPDPHVHLSAALVSANRLEAATYACLHGLAMVGEHLDLYRQLGIVLYRRGLLREAALAYTEALRCDPDSPELLFALADVHEAHGDQPEAARCRSLGLTLDNNHAARLEEKLTRLMKCREWTTVLDLLERTPQVSTSSITILVAKGECLARLRRLDEADELFRAALALDPENIDVCRRLLDVALQRERRDEAHYIWLRLAILLQKNRAHAEAIDAFEHALAQKKDSFQGHSGLGQSCLGLGDPRRALPALEAAVALDPRDAPSRTNLGQAWYLMDEEQRGWNGFAYQYRAQVLKARGLEQDDWDGAPLDRRTLLLWADQGRGDVIQFLRYIPCVARMGGRIVVQCPFTRLVPFIERMPDVASVCVPGGPCPSFDVHAPLVYLPAILPPSRRPSIPGVVPYLWADPRLIEHWRERLGVGGGLKVGLSWGGNIEHGTAEARFLALASFAPLGALEGVRIISLQHGPQAAELVAPPPGLAIETVLTPDSSIEDVGGLLMNLDLIISVDTMIAHLAGAMGRPVWTLLRLATNWRWKLEGDRTPWYPTMRLFRQKREGDWGEVIREVLAVLTLWRISCRQMTSES